MGKLNPPVVLHRLLIERFVLQRIIGKPIADRSFLFLSEKIIEAIVQPRQQDSALFQHPEALPPDGKHILHVAVGNRMKNQVKAFRPKWQRLRHIRPDQIDGIPLPLCHQLFHAKLLFGIIQNRTFCSRRRENGHLLAASGSKAQHPGSFQITEPVPGDRLCRRQIYLPFSLRRLHPGIMINGSSPFPSVFYPAINRFRVDLCVISVHFHLHAEMRSACSDAKLLFFCPSVL